MRSFDALGCKKVVIGLVHLLPLPGTPFYEPGNTERALDKAVRDATALSQGGADGCLIQTVDRVYPTGDEADYARVAAMAAITRAVAEATPPDFQIGVQIMVNALKASAAVATVCDGSFLRCTALVGATVTPSGIVEANPLDFLTYRARIGGDRLKLIAEVDSMHFHWMGDKPTGRRGPHRSPHGRRRGRGGAPRRGRQQSLGARHQTRLPQPARHPRRPHQARKRRPTTR